MSTELEAEVFKDGVNDFSQEVVTDTEAFGINVTYSDVEYLASRFYTMSFSNSARALSCIEPGESGLKSTLSEIKISSNQDFQDILSGESINVFFHIKSGMFEEDENGNLVETELTIEEGTSFFEGRPFYGNSALYFSSLPGNNLEHTFMVELTFEDGSSLSTQTVPVQF